MSKVEQKEFKLFIYDDYNNVKYELIREKIRRKFEERKVVIMLGWYE